MQRIQSPYHGTSAPSSTVGPQMFVPIQNSPVAYTNFIQQSPNNHKNYHQMTPDHNSNVMMQSPVPNIINNNAGGMPHHQQYQYSPVQQVSLEEHDDEDCSVSSSNVNYPPPALSNRRPPRASNNRPLIPRNPSFTTRSTPTKQGQFFDPRQLRTSGVPQPILLQQQGAGGRTSAANSPVGSVHNSPQIMYRTSSGGPEPQQGTAMSIRGSPSNRFNNVAFPPRTSNTAMSLPQRTPTEETTEQQAANSVRNNMNQPNHSMFYNSLAKPLGNYQQTRTSWVHFPNVPSPHHNSQQQHSQTTRSQIYSADNSTNTANSNNFNNKPGERRSSMPPYQFLEPSPEQVIPGRKNFSKNTNKTNQFVFPDRKTTNQESAMSSSEEQNTQDLISSREVNNSSDVHSSLETTTSSREKKHHLGSSSSRSGIRFEPDNNKSKTMNRCPSKRTIEKHVFNEKSRTTVEVVPVQVEADHSDSNNDKMITSHRTSSSYNNEDENKEKIIESLQSARCELISKIDRLEATVTNKETQRRQETTGLQKYIEELKKGNREQERTIRRLKRKVAWYEKNEQMSPPPIDKSGDFDCSVIDEENTSKSKEGEQQVKPPAYGNNNEEVLLLKRQLRELQRKFTDLKNEKNSNHNKVVDKRIPRAMQEVSHLKEVFEAFKQDLCNKMKKNFRQDCFMLGQIAERVYETREKYLREVAERRRLHNLVQEMRGNIRVFCRARPLLTDEKSSCLSFDRPSEDELGADSFGEDSYIGINVNENTTKSWNFDRVFSPSASNAHVFEELQSLIISCMDGYNVCIFAYGPTGSGKTYSMAGSKTDAGIYRRTFEALFEVVRARKSLSWEYNIKLGMLEVYNEELRDLLHTDGKNKPNKVQIRSKEDPLDCEKLQTYVPDMTLRSVSSVKEVETILRQGAQIRKTGCTNINEHSSRSHCILQIMIDIVSPSGKEYHSKMTLIDLAGSERLRKSGAIGDTQKEARMINKSLSALGDVIAARAMKQNHVPYRNSTLTYVLQDCLSGDSKTLMLLQVSPYSGAQDETNCSLQFGARVNAVEMNVTRR